MKPALFEPRVQFWLMLATAPGVGPVRACALRNSLNSSEITSLDSHLWDKLGLNSEQRRWMQSPGMQGMLDEARRWLDASDAHSILTPDTPGYPELLRESHGAPPVLFVRGDPKILQQPQLAIVGTRRPTPYGEKMAGHFALGLSELGYLVTSGLALGIDSCAHRAVVGAGYPGIAVLGSGLNQLYPKRNRMLAREIGERGGALVSEHWPSVGVRPEHFPRRNRIISGLSLGTLVVEASLKSGSLITARYTLEQGRELFAIPGSLLNPQADGSNQLIQNNAKLVRNVADIVEEIGALEAFAVLHYRSFEQTSSGKQDSLPTDSLLELVDYEVTSLDEIAERSLQSVGEIIARLTELELEGWVEAVAGGYVRIRRR
ncbi:DNA-processing protein DprA [Dongshaea marina]|uniref:DNA-processing protein DprA n=1 Tax=Dongshaea marina TaxID=2047966 RepID=UPI000D3E2F1B|nr:DNA-processing protein DprA [Dongshaea marina]